MQQIAAPECPGGARFDAAAALRHSGVQARIHTWMRDTRAVVVLIACAIATPAFADEGPYPDRWMFRLGGYNVSGAETVVRLDVNALPVGTYLDFAEDLGGETSARVARLDGYYRFNDRHALGFSWYSLKFDGHRAIDQQVNWGDKVYNVNAVLDSSLEFDIYKVNYLYSLYHNETVELGALIGLHVMDTATTLSEAGTSEARGESVTAPLPVWGLFADYHFTPRWSAYFNYQLFFVSYEGKVKGGLQDFLIGTEYRLFRNFAIGGAYNRFGMKLESKDDADTLRLTTNWNGLMLYGSLYF